MYYVNNSEDKVLKCTTTITSHNEEGLTLPDEISGEEGHEICLQPGEHYAYPMYWIGGKSNELAYSWNPAVEDLE
jgi:hypothetical protein